MNRLQSKTWITVIVVAAALLLAAYIAVPRLFAGAPRPGANQSNSEALGSVLKAGSRAPAFTLKTLHNHVLSLSGLRGQPVFLNFWATWCTACKNELPLVIQAQKIYGQQIKIVGVDVQENPKIVAHFQQENGLNYTIALDRQGSVMTQYGVQGLPTSYFINRRGIISAIQVGGFSNLKALEADIAKAVHGS